MNINQAALLRTLIVNAFPDATAEQRVELVEQFQAWEDFDIANQAVNALLDDDATTELPSRETFARVYTQIAYAQNEPHSVPTPHPSTPRLPATADAAWTCEGAHYAMFGKLPAGMSEAQLAELEQAAQHAWDAGGTNQADRIKAAQQRHFLAEQVGETVVDLMDEQARIRRERMAAVAARRRARQRQ